jgi:NAD(P)-dependent dehydrogenase (short-subunit alcohol dehydrogenase family)
VISQVDRDRYGPTALVLGVSEGIGQALAQLKT